MAKYIVTQKLKYKGSPVSSSFQMEGDDADVTALTALLEGGYEVKKVDESLSNMAASQVNNELTNPVTKITLNGPQNQFSVIRPFSGVIHFKESAQVEDIKAALSTSKPFALLPTETPTSINVVRKEYMA